MSKTDLQMALDSLHEVANSPESCEIYLDLGYEYSLMRAPYLDKEEAQIIQQKIAAMDTAVKELVEVCRQALDYVSEWPIGIDTEPQEQRGGARETLHANLTSVLKLAAELEQGGESEAFPRTGKKGCRDEK